MSADAASLSAPRTRSRGVPGHGWLLGRLRWRLTAPALDRRLAAGESPLLDDALTHRAAHLVSRRARERIADGLDRLQTSRSRTGTLSAAAPVDRLALAIAEPALQQLAAALRSRRSVEPRGVAITHVLLTEPGSPLYRPAHPDELYETARRALLTLGVL